MAGEFSVGDVTGTLNFEVDAAIANLARAADSLDRIAEASKRSADAVDSFEGEANRLNGTIELFGKGLEFVKSAFEPFLDFLKESINEAAEDEVALQKLSAALQATGSSASTEELEAFAAAEAEISTQSKNTIIDVERLLTLLTSGHGDVEGLTKAALDLSAGLGIDAETAARALGKAVEGNSTALARFGVDLGGTKDQAKELKDQLDELTLTMGTQTAEAAKRLGQAMIEDARGITDAKTGASSLSGVQEELEKHFSGSALSAIESYANSMLKTAQSYKGVQSEGERANDIIAKVEERFGGQAATEANTYSGLITRLGHDYQELQAAVGDTIIKSEPLRQLIQATATEIQNLQHYFEENRSAITEWVNSGIELAIAGIKKLLEGAQSLADAFGFTSASAGIQALVTGVDDIRAAFEGTKGPVTQIFTTVENGVQAFTNIADGAKNFGDAMAGAGLSVTKLGDAITSVGGGWDAETSKAIAGIKQQQDSLGHLSSMVIKLGDDAEKNPVRPTLDGNKFVDAWNALVAKIEAEAATVGKIIGQAVVDGILSELATLPGKAAGYLKNLANSPGLAGGSGVQPPNYQPAPSGVQPPVYQPQLPGLEGTPTPEPGAPLLGGEAQPPPAASGEQLNGAVSLSLDTGPANQEFQDMLAQFQAANPTVELGAFGSGSPTLPFSEYFGSYAPSVISKVGAAAPIITFRTNLDSIIAQSADWSRKFGDEHLPTGAFQLLAQGQNADPGQLVKAISEALEMKRFYDFKDTPGSHIMPMMANDGSGFMYPSGEDLSRAWSGIAAELERVLRSVAGASFGGPTFRPMISMSPAVPFSDGVDNMKKLVGDVSDSAAPITFEGSVGTVDTGAAEAAAARPIAFKSTVDTGELDALTAKPLALKGALDSSAVDTFVAKPLALKGTVGALDTAGIDAAAARPIDFKGAVSTVDNRAIDALAAAPVALKAAVDAVDTRAVDAFASKPISLNAGIGATDLGAIDAATAKPLAFKGAVDAVNTGALDALTAKPIVFKSTVGAVDTAVVDTAAAEPISFKGALGALDAGAVDALAAKPIPFKGALDSIDTARADAFTAKPLPLKASLDAVDNAALDALATKPITLKAGIGAVDTAGEIDAAKARPIMFKAGIDTIDTGAIDTAAAKPIAFKSAVDTAAVDSLANVAKPLTFTSAVDTSAIDALAAKPVPLEAAVGAVDTARIDVAEAQPISLRAAVDAVDTSVIDGLSAKPLALKSVFGAVDTSALDAAAAKSITVKSAVDTTGVDTFLQGDLKAARPIALNTAIDTSAIDSFAPKPIRLDAGIGAVDLGAIDAASAKPLAFKGTVDAIDGRAIDSLVAKPLALKSVVGAVDTSAIDAASARPISFTGALDTIDAGALDALATKPIIFKSAVDTVDASAVDSVAAKPLALRASVDGVDGRAIDSLAAKPLALEAGIGAVNVDAVASLSARPIMFKAAVDTVDASAVDALVAKPLAFKGVLDAGRAVDHGTQPGSEAVGPLFKSLDALTGALAEMKLEATPQSNADTSYRTPQGLDVWADMIRTDLRNFVGSNPAPSLLDDGLKEVSARIDALHGEMSRTNDHLRESNDIARQQLQATQSGGMGPGFISPKLAAITGIRSTALMR